MKITIETEILASPEEVWEAWVNPDDITKWNFASDDWCCPRATNELVPGGKFNYRMEARDGSAGFDFEGVFVEINQGKLVHFTLGDDRIVTVEFSKTANGVKVEESFDAEDEHSAAQQRAGWQSILNNFKKHVECKTR